MRYDEICVCKQNNATEGLKMAIFRVFILVLIIHGKLGDEVFRLTGVILPLVAKNSDEAFR